jgi:hypothetical protein
MKALVVPILLLGTLTMAMAPNDCQILHDDLIKNSGNDWEYVFKNWSTTYDHAGLSIKSKQVVKKLFMPIRDCYSDSVFALLMESNDRLRFKNIQNYVSKYQDERIKTFKELGKQCEQAINNFKGYAKSADNNEFTFFINSAVLPSLTSLYQDALNLQEPEPKTPDQKAKKKLSQ